MEDYNLDEETLQQLMALGIIPEELEGLKEQISSAQQIRDRRGPQGYDTGRMYVAASPLEHAAFAMQGIKAGKDMEKARLEQQKLLAEQVRGRSLFFNKMNQPTVNPQTQNDVDMGY